MARGPGGWEGGAVALGPVMSPDELITHGGLGRRVAWGLILLLLLGIHLAPAPASVAPAVPRLGVRLWKAQGDGPGGC